MRALLPFLRLARPWWPWMALGALLALLTVLANAALMATAGWFLASMAFAGLAGVSMNYLIPAAMIRFFALVRIAGRYFERLVTHDATLRFLTSLRVWFYEQVEPLAPGPLDRYRSGDLLSRLGRDIDALDNLYLRILVPVAVAVVGVITVTLFMSLYGVGPALWLLACLVAGGVGVPLWALKKGQGPGRIAQTSKSTLRAMTADYVLGCEDLLVAGAEHAQAQLILQEQAQLLAAQRASSGISALLEAVTLGLASTAVLGVLLLSLPLLATQRISGPDLPLLVLLALAGFETVAGLPTAFATLGDTLSAAQRILEITHERPEVPEPLSARPVVSGPVLEFRETTLHYPQAAVSALSGINLILAPGRHIALVGPSGAGKSSLVALALRLRAPTSGDVYLNGQPLAEYSGSQVRTVISGVLQSHHVFNATIAENLRMARVDADAATLERACNVAGLAEDIAALPLGYDTAVGELGMALSGGQRRRLAVAQALLRRPRLLLLDEPTEGLDPHMAQTLIERVLADDPTRGILLITHRTEGLESMDEVMVLEAGHIVETGTAATLRRHGGRFTAFYDQLRIVPPSG
ncbi:MAG: thiol reductant ABC exporter subunit CydC [Acidiferrobacter sp.]